jgi:hypothetical protein
MTMESASEIAQQIKILLSGLARRAESAGLEELARKLEEVGREAAEHARNPISKTKR